MHLPLGPGFLTLSVWAGLFGAITDWLLPMSRLVPAVWIPLLLVSVCEATDPLSPKHVEFFEQRIRPVLVEHCYECHNSATNAEGGLALDHRDALRAGGESGSVLAEAGKPSRLLAVIRHEIQGLEMPEGGAKLSERIIGDFEKWMTMGAPDPRDGPPTDDELAQLTSWDTVLEKRKQWWSFQPIGRFEFPESAINPIDQFVLARLNAMGLVPSPAAEPTVLVRRLTFALTGLPPTPEQIEAFVADRSPNAYENLVDRLLNSPQFGERWARHWMDWIRYAESHGSEGDPLIEGAHEYRDYLIRALNQDVPYDRLVREHIAGDLLPEPRINPELGINESLIGTAHWRMVFHGFAPTDALDEKVRFTDDAINTFSKAFMGLTVSCARCHDHKFDAISQQDYYALFGILASTRPGRSAIELPRKLNLHREKLENTKQQIKSSLLATWESQAETLGVEELTGLLASLLDDQSLDRVDEDEPAESQFSERWEHRRADLQDQLRQQRVALNSAELRGWKGTDSAETGRWYKHGTGLKDAPSPAGQFAVALDGDAVLRGVYPAGVFTHLISDKHGGRLASPEFTLPGASRLLLQVMGSGQAMSRYVVQNYPRNGTVYPVKELAQDEHRLWHWQSYDLDYWAGDQVHIELTTAMDAPLLVKKNPRSWFGIRRAVLLQQPKEEALAVQNMLSADIECWEPLLELVELNPPESLHALAASLAQSIRRAIGDWKSDRLSDSQALLLDRCLKSGVLSNAQGKLPGVAELVSKYRTLEDEIPVAVRVPGLSEWRGSDHRLLERGDHRRPAGKVPRRFLKAFDSKIYETPLSGRLELAEDLLREGNPLTSRVLVNRVWHHLFGRGIVATPDNLGRLGEPPTHPKLLDYLASEFRSNDSWSLKSLIRRIVCSQTWRQSSEASSAARKIDPDNLYLSHSRLGRLDAETIRDTLLATAGMLDKTQFGPASTEPSSRRSVYLRVQRNALDPFLTTFDAPVPFSSKGRRDQTNVPAQSLLLMNSPVVRQMAHRFGQAALKAAADNRSRLQWMWARAFQRPASEWEMEAATEFLQQAEQEYRVAREQRLELESRLEEIESTLAELDSTARQRLQDAAGGSSRKLELPRPYAEWLFDSDEDENGKLNLSLEGSARLESGKLVVDGGGFARTVPIDRELQAKTLETVVELDSLDQRGGGVMSVQTRDGVVFDAIVYGEQTANAWLAGSNNFRRTRPFRGSFESTLQPVHLALVYETSGRVTMYRNGRIYGQSYSTDLHQFGKQEGVLLFGLRHGTHVLGNRALRGSIEEARLYDRALLPREIEARSAQVLGALSQKRLMDILSDVERDRWNELKRLQKVLTARLDTQQWPADDEQWTDLAHSLFNLKEFIYVR